MTDWRPMAEMPDEYRDGRDVLLWDLDRRDQDNKGVGAVVARWSADWRGWDLPASDGVAGVYEATHWAPITPPEPQP